MTGSEQPPPGDGAAAASAVLDADEPAVPPPVGTAEEPPGPAPEAPWWRHDNGRWVVGDAGRQPEVVPVPSVPAADRPDTVVDGAAVRGITYRAASLRGLGHQQNGTPRQDAYLVRPTPDRQWLVGCVADGVSEGRWSHEAADLVCQEMTAGLARGLRPGSADGPSWIEALGDLSWDAAVERLPWRDAVARSNAAVVAKAEATLRSHLGTRGRHDKLAELDGREFTPADARRVMSTTAVAFLLATEPLDGAHPAAVAVVAGDSAAFLLDEQRWTPLTAVKNEGAEVLSSAVEPLPREVTPRPYALMLRPGQALAVVTDGLGDPLGSGAGVVGRYLADVWERPPDLLAFAQHVGFYRRTFTDDRTAVVVWPGPR